MMRGVRCYDTPNNKYYTNMGGIGNAWNGSEWTPTVWSGMMDIYDDHVYLYGINMTTIINASSFSDKAISQIYGVW